MSKFSPMRFDVEKFDGRINFGLWQVQVKDVLIQSGLHNAVREVWACVQVERIRQIAPSQLTVSPFSRRIMSSSER